ncbi:MAG: hypothetical protein HUU41_07990 [Bryobacteraceae bacterium]|nr:hypothetical protein [Bryobacterales bacterium]NUN01039.1 hypothetical protein [Bryobacteraceae bacterium]
MLGAVTILAAAATLAAANERAGLLVALDSWNGWQALASAAGWAYVPAAQPQPAAPDDATVKALNSLVASKASLADPARVYLAGRDEAAAAVFYAVSRMPHLWAGAVAIQGDPVAAIETNRLFSANTSLVPFLWAAPAGARPVAARLHAAGFPIDFRDVSNVSAEDVLQFLNKARQDEFPAKIDCESGNPHFGRCYWLQMETLDASHRNDALPVSRVPPGSGAYLVLGGFGYDPRKPGPGVEVGWLPEGYKGPLKTGDAIVSIAGRAVANPAEYRSMLEQVREPKPTAIMIQRGKQRIRIETRFELKPREEQFTARVQAEYLSWSREMVLISRGVSRLKLNIPAHWAPVRVNWNGQAQFELSEGGCWVLSDNAKHAGRCDWP